MGMHAQESRRRFPDVPAPALNHCSVSALANYPDPSLPPSVTGSAVYTCKLPSSAYRCTSGTATTGAAGTCSVIACNTNYLGAPTAPVCSSQGAMWTFTGTCTREWGGCVP